MGHAPNRCDMEYIGELIFESFRVPVIWLNDSGNIVHEWIMDHSVHPFHAAREEHLAQAMQQHEVSDHPVLITSAYLEHFALIPLKEQERRTGSVVLGPILFARLSDETLSGLMNDYRAFADKKAAVRYYESLPVLSKQALMNAAKMVYYMIYRKRLNPEIAFTNEHHSGPLSNHIEHADITIAKRRQNILLHHDPVVEKKLYHVIKEGRTSELETVWDSIPEEGLGVLSKTSHIRSQKNLTIAMITLATRYAMEGGLHPEIAYTLSDLFIQRLEELHDRQAIDRLRREALRAFTERVNEARNQQYSKPVTMCIHYIFNHLYEEMTLPLLAEQCNKNPSYLSALFKKETGVALSEYIQRTRIEEAKKLLTLTDRPIAEIGSLLNFHEQSYFTKIFKKFAGVTPKQYRNKYSSAR